jgi:hypothetical protein
VLSKILSRRCPVIDRSNTSHTFGYGPLFL